MAVDDRDLRLTIRGSTTGGGNSDRRKRMDERFNSGGDLRSRLGARRCSGGGGGMRCGSGDDSLERENLDVDLRAELSKKRSMQIEVRGDGSRRRRPGGKKVGDEDDKKSEDGDKEMESGSESESAMEEGEDD